MHMYIRKMPIPINTKTKHPMHKKSPNQIQTPLSPSPPLTIQVREYTFCHDRFPDQALAQKHTKYDPLINIMHTLDGKLDPPPPPPPKEKR